jgi:hypothetical protein
MSSLNLAAISSDGSLSTVIPAYKVTGIITRQANATPYSAGCVILNGSDAVLPPLDFSTSLGFSVANRQIVITSAYLISDNGANPAFSGFIDLMRINNPVTNTTLADGSVFDPTAAGLVAAIGNRLDDMTNSYKYAAISNITWQADMTRKVKLDANGMLYFALVPTGGYTPKSGEVLTLILKFYLLN